MILGQRDRERVDTAELRIVTAEESAVYWQDRTAAAEAARDRNAALVMQEVAQNERLTEWARGIAVEAGEAIDRARDAATAARLEAEQAQERLAAERVQAVEAVAGMLSVGAEAFAAIRDLHDGVDGSPCRHCGWRYPCPTVAALPSDA